MLRQMRNQMLANQAANTARALQRAPTPPRTLPSNTRTQRRAQTPPRQNRPMNLNTKLRLLQQAILAQKRRRAQENEERQLRLLALRMPSVPKTVPKWRR